MKTYLLVLSCLLYIITVAQKVVAPAPGIPGSWRQLGVTVVNFTADHDVIHVAGADAFRALRFRVLDAPIRILDIHVIYENGAPDKLNVQYLVPAGGESRVIDLRGGIRKIRRIDFWYQSGRPGFRGRAKVALWGMK